MDQAETHLIEQFNKHDHWLQTFLMGLSASAIAFATQQTSDREPTWSLMVVAAAVLCWAGSFAAAILRHRAWQGHLKTEIALGRLPLSTGSDPLRTEGEAKLKRDGLRVNHLHLGQLWLFALGALLYVIGHALYLFDL